MADLLGFSSNNGLSFISFHLLHEAVQIKPVRMYTLLLFQTLAAVNLLRTGELVGVLGLRER